jgi:hypothetical protein
MKLPKLLSNHGPLMRAVFILSAVAALVTGVTFASLQSQQAALTGNSIQSATADLRIGTSASTFDASRTGFTFKDVVPGGPAMPVDGQSFYLKNYGSASLSLKLVVGSSPTNTANVDLSKVKLQLTRVDNEATQASSVQMLSSGGLAITDPIAPGVVVQYKLRALMDEEAFSGTAAVLGGIDLVFSGVVSH